MPRTTNPHPDEEAIERYALGRSSVAETEHFEEHLLICQSCQQRLDDTDAFLTATHVAAQKWVEKDAAAPYREPWWQQLIGLHWFGLPAPAYALALTLLVAVVILQPWRSAEPAEWQTVALATYRGADVPSPVKSGVALRLHLDATGLAAGPAIAQLVDANGRVVLASPVEIQNARAELVYRRALAPGQYWVRLTVGNQLLREYSLPVKTPGV